MTGCVVLRGKSALQLYARNMMAVSAASAVLAAGVVTMPTITADIAAPRIVTADIALVVLVHPGPINCSPMMCTGPQGGGFSPIAAVPAYALTQAAYLASDVVAVAAAGVAYGATSAVVCPQCLLYDIRVAIFYPIRVALETRLTHGQKFPPPPAPPLTTPASVQAAAGRLGEAVVQLKEDWANTANPAHYQEYVAGLASTHGFPPPGPALEVASVRSRPVAAVPSRAWAAAGTVGGHAPSAKAAAATVETAPTAEQGQRRATRGAAHRTERSGAGRIE